MLLKLISILQINKVDVPLGLFLSLFLTLILDFDSLNSDKLTTQHKEYLILRINDLISFQPVLDVTIDDRFHLLL